MLVTEQNICRRPPTEWTKMHVLDWAHAFVYFVLARHMLLKNHSIWSWSANGNSWHSGEVVFQLVYSIMISILKLFGRGISLTVCFGSESGACIVGSHHIFVITQLHALPKTYSINTTTTNKMTEIGMRQRMAAAPSIRSRTIWNNGGAFRRWESVCHTLIYSKCKHFHYESSSAHFQVN